MELWRHADLGATYLRLVASSASVAILYSAFAIAAKWLLIGRWKTETIPVWSLRYSASGSSRASSATRRWHRFGGPFYNLYLRLLGAKIGRNAVIHAQLIPVCTDLISIGANTILRKDSIFLGYKAQSNLIHTGPINIGANAFVGEAGDPRHQHDDGGRHPARHASSLHERPMHSARQALPWLPARETTADYCAVEPRACTPLRRGPMRLAILAGFAALPVPLLVLY